MSGNKSAGWRRLNRKQIYDNPWIAVSHDEVITPGGTEGIYGVVHFKTHAVGVIPIDDDGNTWLVRQSRYTLDQQTWEIPEGGAPRGGDLLAAAKRELEEETGLRARNWRTVLNLHLSNSVTDEEGTVFVATDLYAGRQQLEASEDIVVAKLPLRQAIAMVMAGDITDALSVAGLLRLAADSTFDSERSRSEEVF
ncbi:NUDIX domain-containing protein [Gilvimarinus sp. F26214L]|uniref:NUDIX domain-containing protein n=1 Tax=Gilvimarinus sp. DZF01 TaxID=3461371 RepID=UPI004045DAAD